jgi:hypothetical protein
LSEYRARYLESYVTEEENPNAETDHPIVKSKVTGHSNRRICDAGAIEVIGHVKEEYEWKQSNGNLTPGMFRRRSCNGPNRA